MYSVFWYTQNHSKFKPFHLHTNIMYTLTFPIKRSFTKGLIFKVQIFSSAYLYYFFKWQMCWFQHLKYEWNSKLQELTNQTFFRLGFSSYKRYLVKMSLFAKMDTHFKTIFPESQFCHHFGNTFKSYTIFKITLITTFFVFNHWEQRKANTSYNFTV